MTILRRNGWREPPIVFQILVLLLGGLVVAQFVTLLLTMVFPPAPPVQHSLRDVVAALHGGSDTERGGGKLVRIVQSAPPDVGGPGWFTSAESSAALATMLHVEAADVRLAFYAPLPFAGATAPPPGVARAMAQPIAWSTWPEPLRGLRPRLIPASLLLYDAPGGDGHGGGFGSGLGFPGGGMGQRGQGDGFPGLGSDRAGMGQRGAGGLGGMGRAGRDGGGFGGSGLGGQTRPGGSPSPGDLDRQPAGPFGADRGGRGEGGDRVGDRPGGDRAAGDRSGGDGAGGGRAGGALSGRSPIGGMEGPVATGGFDPRRFSGDMQPLLPVTPSSTAPTPVPAQRGVPEDYPAPQQAAAAPAARAVGPAPVAATVAPPVPAEAASPPTAAPRVAEARPIPIAPRAQALFGLAPAPFVEGDFVAAERMADGRWAVVQPRDEGFPNAWQRRVILWFAIAFALVAPIGWLFARHIVRPLASFTEAAERLGRDPSAALVALEGPAEIGRAAHAFNVMQNRLRSFVDDRTAMVGAISHDLRTPLTRMRFRIEEVEDDAVREGMSGEVTEMEAMISSVLAFIRDASTPNVRERLDLGMLVEDVAQDAALIGGDVTVERIALAPVEVDVLGMRRLLANLVENAVKYGERARIRLGIDEDAAVADILDDGPGVPDDEMERAFEPFYRASNAAVSGKQGSGLGLAVCRSIARAHGGDVLLVRSEEGFAARLRLPLAYDATRQAA